MNNKLKAALIGGGILGVLSVIPFVSTCCCLWAVLGGMLATNFYIKSSPTPATAGDGAILGAMAGAIGAVISIVLGIPIDLAMRPTMTRVFVDLVSRLDARQAELLRQQFEAAGTSISSVIVNALILAALLFFFAVIGGLLGVPIFEKRKGGPPPPPPFNPAGGPSGYAA
jgi:hypothetical protein